MNFDGEWNDSRQCLFAELFLDYYRHPRFDVEIKAKYESRVILFIGRLIYYKGVDILIKAFNGLDA